MHELAQTHERGRPFGLSSRRRLVVAVWSVVVTAAAVGHYLTTSPPTMMQSRIAGVTQSIDVLDRGGPPLLVSKVPYRKGLDRSQLTAAGTTDDEGIYLYLPLLGHWTGQHDPERLMQWLFTVCFGFLILVLPAIVFAIFDSVAAAVVASPLVLIAFNLTNSDLYWIQAWIALLGIPGLVLAHRSWQGGRRRQAGWLLVGIATAASFATSIRAQAGLGVVIAGAGVALFSGGRPRTRSAWTKRLALILALAAAYASVGLAFDGVRAYRDHVAAPAPSEVGTSHPFWHPAYLGLGFLPNRYGIVWSDSVAADAVQREAPGATYLSPRYERTLRHLYLALVEHDPIFVLRTYVDKARVIGWDTLKRFWLLPILLLVARSLRARLRGPVLIAAPAILLGAASPIFSIPMYGYELGLFGAIGASWVLAVAWALTRWPVMRRLHENRRALRPDRVTLVAGITVIAAAVLAATGRSAPSLLGDYVGHESPLRPVSLLARPSVARWRFAGSVPHAWRAEAGTSELVPDNGETEQRGLHVLTPSTLDAVVLRGPAVRLPAGNYRIAATGRVLAGGLRLEAVDADTGAALAHGDYWWGEGNYLDSALTADFVVKRPSRIRLTLSNWTTVPNASSWVLWSAAIQRERTRR